MTIEGPAEDIGADMAEASVFVLSSRFEGFPLILLEAMSKGMGIVSFDCPTGPADIVDDHRNGLLVPHEDVEGLSRAIREIVEDEELRRRMAAAAIETAAAVHDRGDRPAVGGAARTSSAGSPGLRAPEDARDAREAPGDLAAQPRRQDPAVARDGDHERHAQRPAAGLRRHARRQ